MDAREPSGGGLSAADGPLSLAAATESAKAEDIDETVAGRASAPESAHPLGNRDSGGQGTTWPSIAGQLSAPYPEPTRDPVSQQPRAGRNRFLVGVVVGSLLIGGPVGGAVGGAAGAGLVLSRAQRSSVVQTLPVPAAVLPVSSGSARGTDLTSLYERTVKSVVQINSTRAGARGGGIGSGFVIDGNGHVLTNNHVVDGADRITVRFSDGSESIGKVIGRDPAEDLAIVETKVPSGVPAIALADSDAVRPGEAVVAIGSPEGLSYSITAGIVSGIERTSPVGSSRPLRGLIQTDAAINPGNSGGPLLTMSGQAIGINTLRQTNVEAIGFAVPSNTARRMLPRMLAGETIVHTWLGISAKSDGSSSLGVEVAEVVPDGPAGRAGLRAGDIITAIDGTPVSKLDDVRRLIDDHRVGDVATIQITRGGQSQTIGAKLQAWPSQS